MPYDNSTQKEYGENPLQKKSGFKMKGWSPFTQKAMRQVKGQKAMTGLIQPDNLSFDEAFSSARKKGVDQFKWKGKKYHTKTAEEV
jgi:hypothetical protein